MIKVSIIIPAYNAEKYIFRSLHSALNQTLQDLEVVVINDGSTDRTRAIVEDIATKDSRVKVLNIENSGVSNARNIGINNSQGEYIQFLDSDDWIEPNMSLDMYSFAVNKKCDIVVSNLYRDDDSGNLVIWKDLKTDIYLYSKDDYLKELFSNRAYHSVWNKIYKKEIFNDISFPKNISLGEDFVMMVDISLNADNIGKIDRAYYHYIINPNSITEDGKSKKFYQLFDAYSIIEDRLHKAEKYSKYYRSFSSKKFNDFSAFIHQKPYYHDYEYIKSFNQFIEYLHSKPKIEKSSNKLKQILMRYLISFPYNLNVKIIISTITSLKKFKHMFRDGV